jgi:hypothetical protein
MATVGQSLCHFTGVFADAGEFGGKVKTVDQDAHLSLSAF